VARAHWVSVKVDSVDPRCWRWRSICSALKRAALLPARILQGELLGITAVHPLWEETIFSLLEGRENGRQILNELLESNKRILVEYEGNRFFVRKM